MSSPPPAATGVGDALNAQSGTGQRSTGISISTFLASLATAMIIFAVEFFLFLLLKGKLTRIYQPRTYLVPERERVEPSPAGFFRWFAPVFRTSNSQFIRKCGLDAYFFLRYLRMLLKIFIPLSLIILPILVPLNKVDGRDQGLVSLTNGTQTRYNVTGLDQLAWGNVRPTHTDRYWGHLVLAVIVVVYVCAIFFDELRGYIRLRQAYLTSPQHRLRASATTVLVTSIPSKFLSVEALDRLFDVFPGGVRNIWLNRNLDQLNEKIKLRSQLALMLESAETTLIRKCKRAQLKQKKREVRAGKRSKADIEREKAAEEKRRTQLLQTGGVSAGDPHQTIHSVQDLFRPQHRNTAPDDRGRRIAVPLVGGAIGAVGSGAKRFGNAVIGGVKKTGATVSGRLGPTEGFQASDEPSNQIQEETVSQSPPEPDTLHRDHVQERNPGEQPTVTEHRTAPPSGDQGTPGQPLRRQPTGLRQSGQSVTTNGHNGTGNQIHSTTESPISGDLDEKAAARASHQQSWPSRVKRMFGGGDDVVELEEYPAAFDENYDEDDYGEPMWMKYIKGKDRETIRLPIFGWSWMPALPFFGKKVDKIYHCRKELARLNLEIEIDQQHPERFPLMNSAFVQFNHQVAAHMACQSVSHHMPKQMTPRMVEISPDDVIWDNMSIKWWERYLRTFGVIIIVAAMVVGWAFPVAFTGLLSQLSYLEGNFSWLAWLSKLPKWVVSAAQGILPPLFLAILMALLPVILRFLTRNQGVHTGMAIELTVQHYYFAFLFVQVFLVVSISSGFSTILNSVRDVTSVPSLLAENIPKASNYFFSYMVLQAMSVSAGALVQIFGLVSWFILAPIFDNTARMKWARTTNLNQVQWGTFFPVYTNLASIGLIYSIISPLILVFNVLTFSLFWIVYRYNTLYVTKFRFDTGGLLFPRALNQLFTGVYVMEICLIGMFFLVRDSDDNIACEGQAICMIVVLILTALFQYLVNDAFNPLFRYLPISLEDDAIKRDEEFALAQRRRLGLDDDDAEDEEYDYERQPGEDERPSQETLGTKGVQRHGSKLTPGQHNAKRSSWADRSPDRRSAYFGGRHDVKMPSVRRLRQKMAQDAESQAPGTAAIGQALFSGINDELEDLTPEERDQLVQRAFQHEALRARRPVIWIPRDDLGVSDDEVFRTQRFSKHIWISNEYQALDGKCRAIFSRSPPDFSEVDLIQL